jgi:uncharacterized protein YcaQ
MNPIPASPLPLAASRALALQAQGLITPNGAEPVPTLDVIYQTVERLGCVQIDTLNLVQRSQFVTLWSRIGPYDPADFDRLIFDPTQRRLFEYWMHAAAIIPLADYRYRHFTFEYFRNGGGWWHGWMDNPDNWAVIDRVRERIRADGALRSADFESGDEKRGSWWDWKPAKHALERLYNMGELMITNRVNFQRVYDLRERVLPDWVDTTQPTQEEAHRFYVERAARALGIAQIGQLADYAYMKRNDAAPTSKALLAEGVLVEVEVVMANGKSGKFVVHRDTLPLLQQAADGALIPARTTFLNPFDPLFWARDRDEQLWGFTQTLEAYKRAPDRIWGYYCLPILHRDRLIGRFDPKLERKTGVLRLKALYLEPGLTPDDDLIADVSAALRNFMAWHGARDLVIEKSTPLEFGERLLG